MNPKTEIVSYRTTRYARRRLGALAKRQFIEAGFAPRTLKRGHVSLYLGQITDAIVAGRLKIKPGILAGA